MRVGSGEILECRNSAQGVLMSQSQLSVEEILWSNNSLFFVFVRRLSTQKMYEWVVVKYWSVVTVHKVFSCHNLSCLLKKSCGAIIPFSLFLCTG